MALKFWELYLGTYRGTLSGNCFRGSIAERDGSGVLGVVSGDVSGGFFQGTVFGGVLQRGMALVFWELFRCRIKVRGAGSVWPGLLEEARGVFGVMH